MAESYAISAGDGSSNIFTVDFDYLSKSHVKVYLDGVLVDASTLTWPSAGQVQLPDSAASLNGKVVLRKRETPSDAVLSSFVAGPFDTAALNLALKQMLYLQVELAELPTIPYQVAHLPSASGIAGAVRYCWNETGGATPVFSDGTNWRRVSDRAIAS